MANPTSPQVPSDLDRTAEVQGYFTPVPIPLPRMLPASVRTLGRSLGSSTMPHPGPLAGISDQPNPALG
jgi:hypothetical protein